MNLSRFFTELRRRKVIRVAVVYGVVGWIIIQVAHVVFPALEMPAWSVQLIVLLVLLGFPIALVLAWAFELTPEGIQRDVRPGEGSGGGEGPPAVAGGEASEQEGKRKTSWVVLGTAVGGVLLVGGYLALSQLGSLTPAEDAADTAEEAVPEGVAVLPFDNFGQTDEDYFSDGITEDIIAQLARIPDLTVVSRTSAMRFKDTDLTLREIGRELGAGAILEGSVRRDAGRVRIVAQLVDTRTDAHVWAETYDREMEDIFQVQTEVASQIAEALGRTLVPRPEGPEADEAPTDLETYELYLRGRHLWHQRRVDALHRASEYFRQAVERDPDFALGHVALAEAYAVLPFYDRSVPTLQRVALARESARRAIELDPEMGEAYTVLAHLSVMAWEWDEAEGAYRRALELTPGYASLHQWYGAFQIARGDLEAAVRHTRRAIELDPVSPRIIRDLAGVLLFSGHDEEAVETLERGRELGAAFLGFHLTEVEVYRALGRDSLAFEALVRARDFVAPVEPATEELRAAFAEGGYEAALRLVLDRAPEVFAHHFDRAGAHLDLGDVEGALQALEASVEEHEAYSAWVGAYRTFSARNPEALEELVTDPRFEALERRVGAPRP